MSRSSKCCHLSDVSSGIKLQYLFSISKQFSIIMSSVSIDNVNLHMNFGVGEHKLLYYQAVLLISVTSSREIIGKKFQKKACLACFWKESLSWIIAVLSAWKKKQKNCSHYFTVRSHNPIKSFSGCLYFVFESLLVLLWKSNRNKRSDKWKFNSRISAQWDIDSN